MQYYFTRVPCHVASDMNAMGYNNYDIMNIVTIIKKKHQRK